MKLLAKQLRVNMTDAEKLLWYHLRGHQFLGVKFKRQQPLGNYIVDFISFEHKIIIEVDGGQHLDSESDKQRDTWLQGQGFQVLRFWNNEVLGETESVLEKILQALTPSPLVGEGQGRGVKSGGKNIERVRWRSRRGLLELDIVLGRFIDAYYMQLNEAELLVFEELLDMPDNPLWDMIAGRQEATLDVQQALLEKIKLA